MHNTVICNYANFPNVVLIKASYSIIFYFTDTEPTKPMSVFPARGCKEDVNVSSEALPGARGLPLCLSMSSPFQGAQSTPHSWVMAKALMYWLTAATHTSRGSGDSSRATDHHGSLCFGAVHVCVFTQ